MERQLPRGEEGADPEGAAKQTLAREGPKRIPSESDAMHLTKP